MSTVKHAKGRSRRIIAAHAVVDFLTECMPKLDDKQLLEIADLVGYEQARRIHASPATTAEALPS